jgi:hypothetical protein
VYEDGCLCGHYSLNSTKGPTASCTQVGPEYNSPQWCLCPPESDTPEFTVVGIPRAEKLLAGSCCQSNTMQQYNAGASAKQGRCPLECALKHIIKDHTIPSQEFGLWLNLPDRSARVLWPKSEQYRRTPKIPAKCLSLVRI